MDITSELEELKADFLHDVLISMERIDSSAITESELKDEYDNYFYDYQEIFTFNDLVHFLTVNANMELC